MALTCVGGLETRDLAPQQLHLPLILCASKKEKKKKNDEKKKRKAKNRFMTKPSWRFSFSIYAIRPTEYKMRVSRSSLGAVRLMKKALNDEEELWKTNLNRILKYVSALDGSESALWTRWFNFTLLIATKSLRALPVPLVIRKYRLLINLEVPVTLFFNIANAKELIKS